MKNILRSKVYFLIRLCPHFDLRLIPIVLWFSSASIVHAEYWDPAICSWAISGSQQQLGASFTAQVAVSAQRNATSEIPVQFYFSESNSITSVSQYLGSTTVTVMQPGSFCSNIVHKKLTIPTKSYGMDCMASTSGFIFAKTGDNYLSTKVGLRPTTDLAAITSFTPSYGKTGTIITITGNYFDEDTAVYIGDKEADSYFYSSTTIFAVIPEGASSNYIKVQSTGNGHKFCIPPLGVSAEKFIVGDPYCPSKAMADGYGRIEYVGTSEFANNLIDTSACGIYSDYTHLVTSSVQGSSKDIYVQFDSCGAEDYAKLFKVYVDWNQDYDFDDPGEYLVDAPTVASDVAYVINASIPGNASLGKTRLRLITALYYDGYVNTSDDVNACTVYPFGETQDYSIDVSADDSGVLRATISAFEVNTTPEGLPARTLITNPKSQDMTIEYKMPATEIIEQLPLIYAP